MTADVGTTPAAGEIGASEHAILAAVADHLIPEAHGMPSAGTVIDEKRLRFVLNARPDLREPLRAALRHELPAEPTARIATLEREAPDLLAALVSVIVFAYYTDKGVRDRLGYPGQQAITIQSWKYPEYLEEGLIDQVLARGSIWRDPATGTTAVEDRPTSMTTPDRQAQGEPTWQ
jgi:hypothetical protein